MQKNMEYMNILRISLLNIRIFCDNIHCDGAVS